MFIKYPKTRHVAEYWTSLTHLDSQLSKNQLMVAEEKMDGTQVGISFDNNGEILIQSRGSYISSDSEFSLLKQWIWQHYVDLFDRLAHRYILFGEWLYAKHTMYYDKLPDYFMEFDVYDRDSNVFLSTQARKVFWKGCTFISSVRVLETLSSPTQQALNNLIGRSAFISENAFNHLDEVEKNQTDTTGLMEGLYLKIENQDQVIDRYKLIRKEFIRKILNSGSHWKSRNIRLNKLYVVEEG